MIKLFPTIPVLVSAALVLAACAPMDRDPRDKGRDNKFDIYEYHELRLVAGNSDPSNAAPKSVNDFNRAQFLNTLNKLDPEMCSSERSLEDCLDNLSKDGEGHGPPNRNRKFRGLGGLPGRAFVAAAQSTFGPSQELAPDVKVFGKIDVDCQHDTSLKGYYYDAARKKLRICVVVKTETAHPGNNPGGPMNPKVLYQYFHVEATHALVEARNDNNPSNVFPAAAVATGLTVDATMAGDLQYKLYAWGGNIRILNYWEAKDPGNSGNLNWKKYQPNTRPMPKRIAEYFLTDKDSCIDMMFLDSVPPYISPGDIAGKNYCLGRCKKPPIVNTR